MPRVRSVAAETIGKNIRTAREAKPWTQDQLAVATGIDSANIRAYEAGRQLTKLHALIRLAEALEVEPGFLLKGVSESMFRPSPEGASTREHRVGGHTSAA